MLPILIYILQIHSVQPSFLFQPVAYFPDCGKVRDRFRKAEKVPETLKEAREAPAKIPARRAELQHQWPPFAL